MFYKQSTSQIIPLYPGGIPKGPLEPGEDPNAYTGKDIPTLEVFASNPEVFIPTLEVFMPQRHTSNRSAIIIFPGGSYGGLAYQEEGSNIGALFAKQGITAFVVKYRLPIGYRLPDSQFPLSGNRYLVPLQDAQQAIKRVRMNAVAWHLDTHKIGVIGFSAGGHLASSLGTHFHQAYIPNKENTNLRPDFMILIYPVISMKDELTEFLTRFFLLGDNQSPERISFFSNEGQVTTDTPPTLLMAAGDDELVKVDNSIVFYQALSKHWVPAEMHLYPRGGHGFVLRLPPEEWMRPILLWMKKNGWAKHVYINPRNIAYEKIHYR
jgi:acetyl esterase/lipase